MKADSAGAEDRCSRLVGWAAMKLDALEYPGERGIEERERVVEATILWYTPMYLARYTPININTHIKLNPSLIESAN